MTENKTRRLNWKDYIFLLLFVVAGIFLVTALYGFFVGAINEFSFRFHQDHPNSNLVVLGINYYIETFIGLFFGNIFYARWEFKKIDGALTIKEINKLAALIFSIVFLINTC